MAKKSYMNFKIPVGAEGVSDVKSIGSKRVVGFVFPSNWVTAALSFDGGAIASNVQSVRAEDKSEYKFAAVAASETIIIAATSNPFAGVTQLRLRSGIKGTEVSQTSSAVVTVLLEE